MTETIDCRGLACPEPVLRVKAALEVVPEGAVTVLVDDPVARENVARFAEAQGCTVAVQAEGTGWRLTAVKDPAGGRAPDESPIDPSPDEKRHPTAFLITSDRLGPEPELGHVLMRAFLSTLGQATVRPAKLLFLNRAVYLTTEGSEALDVLAELERQGTEVLSCGTCLEFLGRKDALRVGRVSNMYDTVETLTGPFRVVSLP
ncbi:MAG: sulfurtransferase-like selenium metabolism protein YedF [Deferrisomatales bacterium]|nr:sulfurtransferase-like selenium metabolism protein YedF [Deferrisomatales bacterium]